MNEKWSKSYLQKRAANCLSQKSKDFWADGYYSCLCEGQTGKRADCTKKQVEKNNGLTVLGCWIDSDKLLSNTYEMGTFKI